MPMIAVVAGAGHLPVEACKTLIDQEKPFFVIALFPEDNKQLLLEVTQKSAPIISHTFYKISTILNELKSRKATHLVMIGKVDKRNLLKKLRFDWLSLKLLASLATKNDTVLLERIVRFIENQGISVLSQHEVLKALLVAPGVLCGKLTDYIKININLGLQLARNISQCDIGQTVVMKDSMILAVEAIEGTDRCIQRGIALGKQNVVICKAAHAKQNKKFDLPTLGPASLTNLQKGQVAAIAWQSSHTLIVAREVFIEHAQKRGITLVSIDDET